MAKMMQAAVMYEAGGPEVLKLESRPVPEPKTGEVLLRVKVFGLNRSEMFTRQGHSPGVQLPRVLGIEAVGVVEAAPGGEFAPGDVVVTAMGGMGRQFDGSYAEYTAVPAKQVQRVGTAGEAPAGLTWETLGALPEMLQTAWGSLFRALRLGSRETLLIRGGTTSVGLAAAAIAKGKGVTVIATTRKAESEDLLRRSGADEVILDTGAIADEVRRRHPEGATKVLELIGVTTLKDSLQCASEGGLVCMTGIVGNKWSFDDFAPMDVIPKAVGLTVYTGESEDVMRTPYGDLMKQIAAGTLHVEIGKVFRLEEIVEAHRTMEENRGGGKIVVLP